MSTSISGGGGSGGGGGGGDVNLKQVNGTTTSTDKGNSDAGTQRVVLATDQPTVKTDGSATTQPVSAAALPLPAGASTAAKQPALGTAGSPSTDVLTVQGAGSGTALPVSVASLPLPTGAATNAILTGGTAQTKITNGTNVADTLAGDTGQNSQVIAGARKEVAILSSGTGTQNVGTTDTGGNYGWVSIFLSAVATSGVHQLQVSNDNTNWSVLAVQNAAVTDGQYSTSLAAGSLYGASTNGARYVRLNITGITAGAAVGVMELTQTGSPKTNRLPSPISGPTTSFPSALTPVFSFSTKFNGSVYAVEAIANLIKTATATASGDTAVWTPTSGKKFKLMGFTVMVTANASIASGGNVEIILRDGTTAIGAGVSVFIPAVAGTTFGSGFSSGFIPVGDGVLSAVANNVLNVNLSAALTAGEVRVDVIGQEQ